MVFRLPPAPFRIVGVVLNVLFSAMLLAFSIWKPAYLPWGIAWLFAIPAVIWLNVPLVRRARRWCTEESAVFVSLVSKVKVNERGKAEEYGRGWLVLREGELQYVASRGEVVRRLPRSPQGEVTRATLDFVGVRTVTYVDGCDENNSFTLSLLPSTGVFIREASPAEVDRVVDAIELKS